MSRYVFVSTEDAIRGMDPQFDKIGSKPIHEWRNHVPDAVQKIWHTFNQEQRHAIVEWAEKLAREEEWD